MVAIGGLCDIFLLQSSLLFYIHLDVAKRENSQMADCKAGTKAQTIALGEEWGRLIVNLFTVRPCQGSGPLQHSNRTPRSFIIRFS